MEKGKYNILNFKLYYIIQGNTIKDVLILVPKNELVNTI